MLKTKNKLFKLVLTALLAALVVGLQMVVGIPLGPFNITLTLIPIVFGSITLGAGYGTALGLVFGLVVSIMSITGRDAGGQAVFAASPAIAWVLCLLKGAAAGLCPALIYRAFKDKKAAPWVLVGASGLFIFIAGFAVGKILKTGWSAKTVIIVCLAAIIAAAYLLIIHYAMKKDTAPVYLASMIAPIANTGIFVAGMFIFFRPLLAEWAGGSDILLFVLTGIVGVNFILEFTVAVIFAPAIAMAAEALMKRHRT